MTVLEILAWQLNFASRSCGPRSGTGASDIPHSVNARAARFDVCLYRTERRRVLVMKVFATVGNERHSASSASPESRGKAGEGEGEGEGEGVMRGDIDQAWTGKAERDSDNKPLYIAEGNIA